MLVVEPMLCVCRGTPYFCESVLIAEKKVNHNIFTITIWQESLTFNKVFAAKWRQKFRKILRKSILISEKIN